ncbi:MAG: PDZ domain-containing protein [Helicobacteraceae bacterium]|jgi:serine protease Do|nr:PDZ domain-containing protein [Helicobacteraceae bacterium]
MRFSLFLPFVALISTISAEEIDRKLELPESFAPVVERAAKNVVYIMKTNDDEAGVGTPFAEDSWFKPYFQYPQLGLTAHKLRASLGSGVIISSDGLIATSAKIAGNRSILKVVTAGSPEPLDAKVLGTDQSLDLAVLKVVGDNLPEPVFADLSAAQAGDLIFAVGNPFGIETVASMGIVSSLRLGDNPIIRADAHIHGGNIGGAIVNARGELMGVPTYIRGTAETGREPHDGFFLPIDRVKAVAERIERSGDIKNAWLGVAVSDLSRNLRSYFGREDGVLITAVEAHSPASNAGLKKGDLLLLADNVILENVADLEQILSTIEAERDIAFLVFRDERLRETVLRVGRFETTSGDGALRTFYYSGATLETLTPAWQERLGLDKTSAGVMVIDVDAGTAAARSGLEAGDLIVQIEGRDVESLTQFQEAINARNPESFVAIRSGVALEIKLSQQ